MQALATLMEKHNKTLRQIGRPTLHEDLNKVSQVFCLFSSLFNMYYDKGAVQSAQ